MFANSRAINADDIRLLRTTDACEMHFLKKLKAAFQEATDDFIERCRPVTATPVSGTLGNVSSGEIVSSVNGIDSLGAVATVCPVAVMDGIVTTTATTAPATTSYDTTLSTTSEVTAMQMTPVATDLPMPCIAGAVPQSNTTLTAPSVATNGTEPLQTVVTGAEPPSEVSKDSAVTTTTLSPLPQYEDRSKDQTPPGSESDLQSACKELLMASQADKLISSLDPNDIAVVVAKPAEIQQTVSAGTDLHSVKRLMGAEPALFGSMVCCLCQQNASATDLGRLLRIPVRIATSEPTLSSPCNRTPT